MTITFEFLHALVFVIVMLCWFVVSHWAALLAALVIFSVGTIIRVRSEEKLLREAFGERFDNYCDVCLQSGPVCSNNLHCRMKQK